MTIPFLKWAGGKRWLVKNHSELFPNSYNRYFEPFLGSGAVFFHLKPKNAVLSDANPRLIETYQAIKENHKLIERYLLAHQNQHSKDYYYNIRAMKLRSKFTRAAQFIYLNRTCWNGLYRENKKGEFNVPIGTKSNVLLTSDNFENTAKMLERAELLPSDFEDIIDRSSDGDLIFVDPPYTVAHNCNGFIKYNQSIFTWDDQVRLSSTLNAASDRGAHIIMTNADHPSIRNLYKQANIEVKSRSSIIGGRNSKRGKTSELFIQL